MVEHIFLPSQAKRNLIISNKLVYELPHMLPNDLKLWTILGNWEISGKSQKFMELLPSAQFSPEMKILLLLVKIWNFLKNWTFPIVRYFTWKLEFVSDILWVIIAFMRFTQISEIWTLF